MKFSSLEKIEQAVSVLSNEQAVKYISVEESINKAISLLEEVMDIEGY